MCLSVPKRVLYISPVAPKNATQSKVQRRGCFLVKKR